MTPETSLSVDEINLADMDFWLREDREGAFAKLRRERPISWHEPPEKDAPALGRGFWALTRAADLLEVSRNTEVFSSAQGITLADVPEVPEEARRVFESMIQADAPLHPKLRRLVAKGFTPGVLKKVEESVRSRAQAVVEAVAAKGECEFVDEVAAALPLQIICDMMGIPGSEYRMIYDHTNVVLGAGDPEYGGDPVNAFLAGYALYQFAQELGRDRLAHPGDDLTSTLMHAEIDGERLSADDMGAFFVLLVVAGNETTRNAISHALKAFTDHPDQRKVWMEDFDGVAPTAVEEIVRWASPVIHMRRTATRDARIGDAKIAAGEKVVMFYNSANRDEAVWDDPFRFDVTRRPNPQAGFGAGGPHFCLGAHLARREITVMFDELFRRLPDIEVSGPPDMLHSAFIHGIKRMPAAFTPA